MNKRVFVLGSITIDNTVFTNVMPSAGTTGKANSFIRNIGGKGANQAVAAYQLGTDVYFFGAVGKDEEGKYISSFLKEKGLKHTLKESDSTTGMAFITINELNGENQILIVQGANLDINNQDIDVLEGEMKKSDIFLTQLENPVETVIYAIKKAKQLGLTVILNPAPYGELPDDVYQYIDYFIPNEHELDQFIPGNLSREDKVKILLSKGVKNVIVTLGENGCLFMDGHYIIKLNADKVEAVDTTAAGDSFVGALVTALSQDKDIITAMRFANKCASITVTRKGAIQSLPRLDEVK